jgi:uncharacterized protein YkwD
VRVVAWVSALFVLAVFVGAGVVYAAHRTTSTSPALAASRQQTELLFGAGTADAQVDPPHVILPPSPSATSVAPVAPPSGGAPPARPRPPSVVIGSQQQVLINSDRASRGLASLSWSGCLYNVALANARRIAAQGYLSHTNGPQEDLGCRLGNRAGENIGYWSGGVNDAQLNTMFMNSPEHYANIMGPYHYVATAWVVASNGRGYIAVEFG